MKKAEIIDSVAAEIVWWIGERHKKLKGLSHETMSVNPFLLPLVLGMHSFSNIEELSDFIVAAHFATGYATGFGKLMDEKILPRVFKSKKLDKAVRREAPFNLPAFNEIDHIVLGANGCPNKLLSLKAGRWTIQLTMAMKLNEAFHELLTLRDQGKLNGFSFDEIVVGVFYGTKEGLTDKYDILRGINRGAKHNVIDLTRHVNVYAGKEFWTWLNNGEEDTHLWVLEGILCGFSTAEQKFGKMNELISEYKHAFSKQYKQFISPSGIPDWKSIIQQVNG